MPVLPAGALAAGERDALGISAGIQAFRYKVTKSPEALANVARAVAGILLARCAFPVDSPFALRGAAARVT